jgi:hypothetical protein
MAPFIKEEATLAFLPIADFAKVIGVTVAVFVAEFPPFIYAVLLLNDVQTPAACVQVSADAPIVVVAIFTAPPVH